MIDHSINVYLLFHPRYFHNRVKAFISKILLSKSNPMCVQFYSFKVEFQQRGAAHIHGIIWLNLNMLERLILIDDELCIPDDTTHNRGHDNNEERPLRGVGDAFKKIKANKKLNDADLLVLTKFIDYFTTVSTHERTVGKDVVQIAKEVNTHHHSKTCRKHGTVCRFNYPKPPSPYTIIAKPVEADSQAAKKERLEMNHMLINKVLEVVEDKEKLDQIMSKFDKQTEMPGDDHDECKAARIKEACKLADVKYEDYLTALGETGLGYSVVLSRDVDEIYVNSYNPEWIRAWDANLDIQVVLDYFAVITYITNYYAKDDTGTMENIRKVMKECQSKDLKDRMKQVANVFLTYRQMGEAEAVYRLVPSMTLSMSNIGCQFVALGPKEERSSRWRKATEADLMAGVPVEELANHQGLWYEQHDMWSKYLRRPDSLAEICFAQFSKMYKSFNPKASKEDGDEPKEDEYINKAEEDDFHEEIDDEFDDEFEKFNYLMTYRNNGRRGLELPKVIEIKDALPGEAPMMKLRTRPVALRFHKIKEKKDGLRYLFNEVMLYYPLQEELSEDQALELYEESYQDRSKVEIVKSQVMEYLDEIKEARHYVEEAHKELDLAEVNEEIGALMDPEGELDNKECQEEEDEEHPDYQFCFPDDDFSEKDLFKDKADDNSKEKGSIFRTVELPSDDELKTRIQGLDMYQKEVVNIGVKYCKDLVKARCLENELPKPPLLMVHGGAGAGKSTVIRVLASLCTKLLQQEGDSVDQPYVLRASMTGCASANIDGNTLHSTFSFPFAKQYIPLNDKTRDEKRAALQNLRVLIVDEVSMMYADMLYMLDLRLQEITMKYVPFGGISIFFFGDLMQLPPVKGAFITKRPRNKEFHLTHEFNPRWEMFQSIVLEKNHRQGEDKAYGDLLNKIRVGNQTDEDLEPLMERVRPDGHEDVKDADLWISCTRAECDKRNKAYLSKIEGRLILLKAKHFQKSGDNFNPRKYLDAKDGAIAGTAFIDLIRAKIGCRVMIIFNVNVIDGITNGQFGMLVDVIKTTTGNVDKLVIRPKDPSIGEENRRKFPQLAKLHPGIYIFLKPQLMYENFNVVIAFRMYFH